MSDGRAGCPPRTKRRRGGGTGLTTSARSGGLDLVSGQTTETMEILALKVGGGAPAGATLANPASDMS